MNRRAYLAAAAVAGLILTTAPTAEAHNRGKVILPNGDCVQVGSLKSVYPGPDKDEELDLIPSDPPDQIGTSFAAGRGNSKVELGQCPED